MLIMIGQSKLLGGVPLPWSSCLVSPPTAYLQTTVYGARPKLRMYCKGRVIWEKAQVQQTSSYACLPSLMMFQGGYSQESVHWIRGVLRVHHTQCGNYVVELGIPEVWGWYNDAITLPSFCPIALLLMWWAHLQTASIQWSSAHVITSEQWKQDPWWQWKMAGPKKTKDIQTETQVVWCHLPLKLTPAIPP